MFEVGRVIKPHGLKGFIKIHITSTEEARFSKGSKYIIEDKEYTIEDIKGIGRKTLIKFFEIDTVEQADKLRNKIIFVSEENLIPLRKDEYYLHDILDCTVYDNSGKSMGEVTELYFAGETAIIELNNENAVSVPLNRDSVKEINTEKKTIILRNCESHYEF